MTTQETVQHSRTTQQGSSAQGKRGIVLLLLLLGQRESAKQALSLCGSLLGFFHII